MKSEHIIVVRFVAALLLVGLTGAATAHADSTQNGLTFIPGMHGPAIGEQFTELASGIFAYSKTDLSLPGPMPINVTRVYRSEDKTSSVWNSRAFGLGIRLNYDVFLHFVGLNSNNQYEWDVEMPDSSALACTSTTNNSPFSCDDQPAGVWFGSVLNGSTLTRPDGTMYSFDPTTGLLLSITDRFTNSIMITRGASPNGSMENSACKSQNGTGSVPPNYVGTVSSSNGRAVYFCYDDPNNTAAISGIADNASGGTIKKVTYTYNSLEALATATQTAFNSHATTT